MKRALIFDIDGTLIDSFKAAGDTYRNAILSVLPEAQIKPHWADYQHVTDTGIFKEVVADLGLPNGELVDRMKREFMERLQASVETNPYHEIAGGKAFLKTCQARGLVGIATGCWREAGEVKLSSAGYDLTDLYLSSANEFDSRDEILENCRLHLQADKVIYFGDALWDLQTTNKLGWDLIGIGEKLKGQCKHWFADYSDAESIFAKINELEA